MNKRVYNALRKVATESKLPQPPAQPVGTAVRSMTPRPRLGFLNNLNEDIPRIVKTLRHNWQMRKKPAKAVPAKETLPQPGIRTPGGYLSGNPAMMEKLRNHLKRWEPKPSLTGLPRSPMSK